ncbi:MAG: coproporphyrinogen-III oxidase family protein [Planctomycetota bacterium]|nr:coproporphyrinogen-III oxidase family protein [Planctomycetota bacterium]
MTSLPTTNITSDTPSLSSATQSGHSTKTEVGSYFISNYPPYSQWNRDSLPAINAAMDAPPKGETPQDTPLGLYLHIPYCRKRCKFCYFKVFTDVNAQEIERYVSTLSHEIEILSRKAIMGERPFRFVYFGGGTPSFLSPKQLTSLVDRLRANISWDKAEEVTFECEPGTLSESKIHTLRELGVTRLSLGIESFSDAILEENGRAHLSKEVYRAWEWIVAAGFPNVNIDLISGMVGENWENWRENIRKTIELSPESVTIYQMELPFNTVYSKDLLGNTKESPVADWPTKRAWVQYAFEEFQTAGYSISSAYTVVKDKSKVSFSYRDNLWRGSDLLATGIASFGHASGIHYQNSHEMADYLKTVGEEHRLPITRAYEPSQNQKLIREMILQLKRGYLDVEYFQTKFDTDIVSQWKTTWEQYESEGFVKYTSSRIELTMDGLLRVDALLPAFFESEHQNVRYT